MVQLIVENEALDLNEKPIMTFQCADIADIDSRQGDFTYEFDLPNTQKNRRLLKRSHYIYGAPYQLINAWFRTSSDVKKGFLQVVEFDGSFRANFFAGNSNWIALIGDKLLSDLDLTRFNHLYSRENIVDSFGNTEGYIYPYMKVESGIDREAYIGRISSLTTTVSDWISFDDLSGSFFNEGRYDSPFYTLDEAYSLSIYLYLDITAITGSTTIGIYKRGGGINYQGLDTQNINSTGQYVFRYTGEFDEEISVGSYLLISSGSITVGLNSFIRFSTSFIDLENINFRDLNPAMYVHSIVNRIFQEIDFKLSGPFLNNPDYKRMIMPFVGTSFGVADEIVIEKSIDIGLDGAFTVNTPSGAIYWDGFDPPYYFDPTYYSSPRYIADGSYLINIEVRFVVTDSGITTSDIEIRKNGVSILTDTLVSFDQTWNLNGVSMSSGDYIEIWIATGDYLEINVGSYFKVTAQNNIAENTEVIAAGLLPEMKQIDLIKFIFVSFGIVPEVDDFSKTLKLTEFRSIKQRESEDWSQKYLAEYELDFYDFAGSFDKINNFNYKDFDEDKRFKNYLSRNKRAYGNGFIQLDNVFLSGEGDIYSNEMVPVWFDEFEILEQSAHLANFARDKEPRILFVIPNASVADFSSFSEVNIDDEVYSVTNIAWAYFTKYQLGTDLDEFKTNLSYSMPAILNPNGEGLLAKYWEDYAGVLERPKMLIARFKLSLKDIITLDYTRRKYIEGENITGYYFLNKIKRYDYDTKLAECELVLINNLDLSEEAIVTLGSEEVIGDNILQEQNDIILQEQNDNILQE
jgi:hypothetical protein